MTQRQTPHRPDRRLAAAGFSLAVALAFSRAGRAQSESAPDAAPPVPTAPTSTAAAPEAHTPSAADAQNPIANVVSLPFQDNTYYNVGPYRRSENVLNFEPVIPIKLGANWNVVTRWIIPIISIPRVSPTAPAKSGVGNIVPQFYFTPSHPAGGIIWGIGPEVWLPTATDRSLGLNKWGGGIDAVVLTIRGHWLIGVLSNNIWAGAGPYRIDELTLNPFAFYNLPKGWYLMSSPSMTANWVAQNNKWTVPLGGGFGRLFKVGNRPINARVQFFDNVEHPLHAATWQTQFQVQFLF